MIVQQIILFLGYVQNFGQYLYLSVISKQNKISHMTSNYTCLVEINWDSALNKVCSQ